MIKKITGVLIFLIITLIGIYIMTEKEQSLYSQVLRLHVIANSDNPYDQALKIEVKDEIVKMMNREFDDLNDADEARRQAIKDIPQIKKTAEQMIAERGYDYPVQVSVGDSEFPSKTYGNLVFPSGKYQAVRVIIGEGEGKNWWCVLFPPLCMVSSSDKGLTLDSSKEAKVSLKCLQLLPHGVKLRISGN
ncbi:MAG: stage II sporulation protein R [Syntrophomonadaceae bacterium]|nr:stage II sporulation protein R [Syntrophomonadaceae bacterium]